MRVGDGMGGEAFEVDKESPERMVRKGNKKGGQILGGDGGAQGIV